MSGQARLEPMRAEITWRGCRLTDKERIREFLSTDREYAAFALGDLDPELFKQSVWYGAETEGGLQALALIFKGFDPPALFMMGDSTGLALLLGSLLREQNVYATCRPEHRGVLDAYYSLGEVERMNRMVLRPGQFRPDFRHTPERLTPAATGELQTLYDTDRSHVAWFQPYQLAQGFYYGIREMGRLVSVAGTHLASLTAGVAAVGNVFTLPECRGRGYASACTSRVTESLLAHDLLVVLNVSETNVSAARIYHRMGYEDYCTFLEIPAVRRSLR